MLICQCNIISEQEIVDVITGFLDADPWQVIVPAKVFRALEKRGKCCACLPNVADLIVRVTGDYHRRLHATDTQIESVQAQLVRLNQKIERKTHARRRHGHRTAQRGTVSRTGRGQSVLGSLPAS